MTQYFKIGEISKLYHIGVDSLRYYEELGLITPQRSGSGYRLYDIHDIWRLNVIRDLRELGFTMEQIHLYLENHSVDSTLALLEEELIAIENKMESLKSLQKNVEHRLDIIRSAKEKPLQTFELTDYPPRRCFSIPEGYTTEEEMDILIKRLLNVDKNRFYVIGNNEIGSVIPLEAAKKGDVRHYQSVFIIDKNGDQILEGGTYLTFRYHGSCSQNATFIPALFDYAKKHSLTLTGDILELLWIDIHISSNMDEHVTELQVRVEK